MFDQTTETTTARLMTIGYEGAEIHDFIATLLMHEVRTLIDVRELPLSRKKGFSKRALGEALDAVGIMYRHVKQLGDPKPGRVAARSGDMATFRQIFGKHMEQEPTKAALRDVVPAIMEGGACLLCFERCHQDCHRAIVADKLANIAAIELAHIGVVHGIARREE